jgi:photosystem II stability/assembly factor-like uncharacterized protein
MNDREFESELRATLTNCAGRAPSGELLAERIIQEALAGPSKPPREFHRSRWRNWTLPLIAAGSVAAIVGSLVGVSRIHNIAAPVHPATTGSSPSAPAYSSAVVVPQPGPSRSGSPQPSTPATSPPANNPTGLSRFRVLDLSFVSSDDAWALGTAACLRDPAQLCTALAHAPDGMRWAAVIGSHSTPFNVAGVNGCAAPCVQHIRFATDQVGYAYGPDALFMTTNGGTSWTHPPGGADALETLAGNVIRVGFARPAGTCRANCTLSLQLATAPVGSGTWTPSTMPAGVAIGEPTLARVGQDAYLYSSGGMMAPTRHGGLLVSTDDGASWANRGNPCSREGPAEEIISMAASAGSDGSVHLLCGRYAAQPDYALTSTDHGLNFSVTRSRFPSDRGQLLALVSASARVLVARCTSTVCMSTDGGASWRTAPDVTVGSEGVAFLGFESAQVGRVVTNGGRTIWTTRDGGLHWTPVTFP